MVYRVVKNRNYTTMSNYHIRDKNLSLKAIGLLCIFLSLPDDWKFSVRGTAAIVKDGKASVASAMKELKEAGYLETKQLRDEEGKLGESMYIISEIPREMQTSADYEAVDYYVPEEGAENSSSDLSETEIRNPEITSERKQYPDCSDCERTEPSRRSPDNPYPENQYTDSCKAENPHPENRDTENRGTEKLCPENRDADNRGTEKPRPGKRDTVYRDTENLYPENRAQINTNKTSKEIPSTDMTKNRGRDAAARYGRYRNVLLTDGEMDSLLKEYPEDYEDMIENLSEYMHIHKRSYADHLATMLAWARKDRMRARAAGKVQNTLYDRAIYRVTEGESL